MHRIFSTLLLAAICMASHAADPLMGLWRVGGTGAVLRIVEKSETDATFDILWEDGALLSIAPGTPVGKATRSPKPGVYDCSMTIDPRKNAKRKGRMLRMVLRLDKTADNLAFEPYDQKVSLDLRAFLPWGWRRLPLKSTDTRPQGLDGATRITGLPSFLEL